MGEREDVATVAWNGGHSSHMQGDCVCGAYPNFEKATTPDYYYSAVAMRREGWRVRWGPIGTDMGPITAD